MSQVIHKRIRGGTLQRLRKRLFAINPLCVICQEKGVVRIADELDHIVPLDHGGTNADDNLQGLCIPCHRLKSAREGGSSVNAAVYPEWLEPASCALTIVFGPPASGKTSYVQKHARQGDTVIDLDVILSEITGKPMYQGSNEWLNAAIRVRNEMLASLKRSNQPAWFITTGQGERVRHWWIDTLKPTSVVLLDTASSVCIERIKADTRRGGKTQEHIEAVNRWWIAETGHGPEIKRKGCGVDGW